MILTRKGTGTPQDPYTADIHESLADKVNSVNYRQETDDYELEFNDDFQRFIVTQKKIATDGVETAVCKYFTSEPVTFYVDDGEITPITVEPENYWAVLEISATSAGRIDVFIQEHQTTIFAL